MMNRMEYAEILGAPEFEVVEAFNRIIEALNNLERRVDELGSSGQREDKPSEESF